jgi:EAL domain-containing protein (putative c-di-GMP-specific phosphodiesterase class I)
MYTNVYAAGSYHGPAHRLRLGGESEVAAMAPPGTGRSSHPRSDEPELDGGSLVVHYQPIVELASRDVRLVEALARLEVGGVLLAPEHWVPSAERSGAIDEMGCTVLRVAVEELLDDGRVTRSDNLGSSGRCTESRGGPRPLGLSVNVAPRQLHGRSLLECVEQLGESGIVMERLCLEITESAIVEDACAMQTVHALRRLGCRIAMDDFGTGYSSLHALTELPIDVLKIDRRLVSRLPGAKARAVLAFVLELGRALGMDVVAEGVETPGQLDALLELGCRLGQGYLLGPPAPLAHTAGRVCG